MPKIENLEMRTTIRSIYLASLLLILALPSLVAAQPTEPVVDGNRIWAQPADFAGFVSWDILAGLCRLPSRICVGEINGIDVTGYTWASSSDVEAMLETLFEVPTPPPAAANDSPWYPRVANSFRPTYQYRVGSAHQALLIGITSDELIPNALCLRGCAKVTTIGRHAVMGEVFRYRDTYHVNDYPPGLKHSLSQDGAWLYREVTEDNAANANSRAQRRH